MSVPGFAIALPSTAADAKGLMAAAIRMDDPCVVIENKALYGVKDDVPEGEYVLPFGQAAVRREGTDITLISYSYAMQPTLAAAEQLATEHQVSAEVIDLRTIIPLDWDIVVTSVEKTTRATVIHEASRVGGAGGEIVAELQRRAWGSLSAPVQRVAGLGTPLPFSPSLEEEWKVKPADIVRSVLTTLGR
jgi:pyruvate dehydrogenase E1 component beta subunit